MSLHLRNISMIMLFLSFVFSFGLLTNAQAAEKTLTKAEVERIVQQYIMDNPMVILTSVDNFQRKEASEKQEQAMVKYTASLFNDSSTPETGNKDGDITIVEFFDYNCGPCKNTFPGVRALLKEDKNVRFIFKEFPILGPNSVLAAKWALAAHKQGKHMQFHKALMENRGRVDLATLTKIALSLELDINRMKQDSASQDIADTIAKNREMALSLGITGTPGFLIDKEVFATGLALEQLKSIIKEKRENKK